MGERRKQTILTVNAMMSAFVHCNLNEHALQLYDALTSAHYSHIQKDSALYCAVIRAVTNCHQFEKGKRIHSEIVNNGINGVETFLIGMYAKCANLNVCQQIFDNMRDEDKHISVWNEMINAHLQNSDLPGAEKLFVRMGDNVNFKTLSLLMNGCSHCGAIDKAKTIWNGLSDEEMKFDSFIIGCLVDCCSRIGHLVEGFEWIWRYEKAKKRQANEENDYAMWMALLSGCKLRGDVLFAHYVYREINQRGFDSSAQSKHSRLYETIFSTVDAD